jgi:hypothetical protein
VAHSTFTGNEAIGGAGGEGGNGGEGQGGAIINLGFLGPATLRVDHCTLSGNRALGGAGGDGGNAGRGVGGAVANIRLSAAAVTAGPTAKAWAAASTSLLGL